MKPHIYKRNGVWQVDRNRGEGAVLIVCPSLALAQAAARLIPSLGIVGTFRVLEPLFYFDLTTRRRP